MPMRRLYRNAMLPLGILLGLWLEGCQPQRAFTVDSQVKIIGGEPIASDSPARLTLVGLVKKSENRLYCSGVLVSPTLVATARHCLTQVGADDLLALFGDDLSQGRTVEVTAMQLFPGSDKVFPNLDVALVQLATAAPQGYHPIEIWHDTASLAPGTSILVAGFGHTATGCSQAAPLCTGHALEVTTTFDVYQDNARFMGVFTMGPTPGKGVCDGDSGGPSYVSKNGRWYVLGVASGMEAVLNAEGFSRPNAACEAGVSTQNALGDYATWIESSSHQALIFDPQKNPRHPVAFLNAPRRSHQDITTWLEDNNVLDPAWYTVKVLVDQELYDATIPDSERLPLALNTRELATRLASRATLFLPSGLLGNYDATIQDLRPLATLTGLRDLAINEQAIGDFSPLAALTSLAALAIDTNQDYRTGLAIPVDVNFVNSLVHLTSLSLRNLTFQNNSLAEGRPFAALSALDLSGNQGLPLAPALWDRFPNLIQLTLSQAGLTTTEDVSRLTRLRQLDLRQNQLTDILPLARLPELAKLQLEGNPIKDFSPLADMPHLKEVSATYEAAQAAPLCPTGVLCHFQAVNTGAADTDR